MSDITEVLALADAMQLFLWFIPIGFLLGCIPFVVGLAVHGIIKIFRQAV
jgi:hypothetical protein